MSTSMMVYDSLYSHKIFPVPSYEEVKNFMEHGRNDEIDLKSHLDIKSIPSDAHDEDRIYQPSPSPPVNRDLVELLRS